MIKNKLTPDDIESIKKMKEAQRMASLAGVDISENNLNAIKNTSYETFIPIDGLPSKGLFYSDKIYGQPLKVEDLLLIQNINEKNWYRIFTEIFSRRIKGVDPNEILICDELYILLWLRANSYPGYNFPLDSFICSNYLCNADIPEGAVGFNFENMNFLTEKTNEVYSVFGEKGYTKITLKSGRDVTIHIKRRKHILRVEKIIERDFLVYGNSVSDELKQLLNIASTISFENLSDLMDVVNIIKNMTPIEFSDLIKNLKQYNIPGEPEIEVKCPKCGEVNRFSGYMFRPSIFIPIDE